MKPWWKDRRRAQSGATLIELLVSLVILGLALTLVVGTFSTGLLESTISKRNTATEAILQYELESISGATFDSTPNNYSDCFATENPTAPTPATGGYQGTCPVGFTLRADVKESGGPSGAQQWKVTVKSWPDGGQIGAPVSVYKVNR
jgi:prepilin-type N-terminal cleavage/methylation domain-containing protein